jgi:hypothetical protein
MWWWQTMSSYASQIDIQVNVLFVCHVNSSSADGGYYHLAKSQRSVEFERQAIITKHSVQTRRASVWT